MGDVEDLGFEAIGVILDACDMMVYRLPFRGIFIKMEMRIRIFVLRHTGECPLACFLCFLTLEKQKRKK